MALERCSWPRWAFSQAQCPQQKGRRTQMPVRCGVWARSPQSLPWTSKFVAFEGLPASTSLAEGKNQENMGLDIKVSTLGGFCSLSVSVAADAPETPGAGCSGKPVMTKNNLWVKLEQITEPAQPQSPHCPPTAASSGETRWGGSSRPLAMGMRGRGCQGNPKSLRDLEQK